MSRVNFALAPTMLLAAGYAASADAATVYQYSDILNLSATETQQDVLVGGDTGATPAARFTYGLKFENDVNTASFQTNGGGIGNSLLTTDAKPGADTEFNYSGSYKSFSIPYAQSVDGRDFPGDDAYLHVRFDLDGNTYTGVAHFDVSSETADGAILRTISYDLTPEVPEPATWAMMIGGMGAVGGAMRAARRRKAQPAKA